MDESQSSEHVVTVLLAINKHARCAHLLYFLFHGTLRYWAQWLDELPMLYGNLCASYILLEPKKKLRHKKLPFIFVSIGLLTTIIYLGFPQYYAFFMWTHTFLIVFITSYSFWRIGKLSKKKVPPLVSMLPKISFFSYLTGFVFWVTENQFCNSLPQWTHFHAWWHIFAGLGCYVWMEWTVALRGFEDSHHVYLNHHPLAFVVVERHRL